LGEAAEAGRSEGSGERVGFQVAGMTLHEHRQAVAANAEAYIHDIQSARCNNHVQTSMNIEEVLIWLRGSQVAARVRVVLRKRERLFVTNQWLDFKRELEAYR
jgi:hypothetical protein